MNDKWINFFETEFDVFVIKPVVPEVLRKSGLARCRVGFSRLSAWCHRVGMNI